MGQLLKIFSEKELRVNQRKSYLENLLNTTSQLALLGVENKDYFEGYKYDEEFEEFGDYSVLIETFRLHNLKLHRKTFYYTRYSEKFLSGVYEEFDIYGGWSKKSVIEKAIV